VEAHAIGRALRRAPHEMRVVAFLGAADPAFALRVLRRLPRPQAGGAAIFVQIPGEAARGHAAAFTRLGWTVRGLGMRAEDWLAEPSGARVDAIVARRLLLGRDAAGRRALLDQAPRRGAVFVASEPWGAFGEEELTADWPQWHSCHIRERAARWRGILFEARSL
jgi:hypothetical protein